MLALSFVSAGCAHAGLSVQTSDIRTKSADAGVIGVSYDGHFNSVEDIKRRSREAVASVCGKVAEGDHCVPSTAFVAIYMLRNGGCTFAMHVRVKKADGAIARADGRGVCRGEGMFVATIEYKDVGDLTIL